MKRTVLILLIVFGLCLVCFLGLQLTWQIGFGLPGMADFYLHQAKYQSIVQSVKALPIAPGATKQAILSGMTVWVDRDRSGSYIVTIRTKDLGHAGEYGYTYSDAVLVGQPDINYPTYTTLPAPGNLRFVDRKMNAHWWSVYNNLD